MAEGLTEEEAQAKLRATGLAATEIAVAATIRPTDSLGATMAAPPETEEPPRPLPRITVDLRGSQPKSDGEGRPALVMRRIEGVASASWAG